MKMNLVCLNFTNVLCYSHSFQETKYRPGEVRLSVCENVCLQVFALKPSAA